MWLSDLEGLVNCTWGKLTKQAEFANMVNRLKVWQHDPRHCSKPSMFDFFLSKRHSLGATSRTETTAEDLGALSTLLFWSQLPAVIILIEKNCASVCARVCSSTFHFPSLQHLRKTRKESLWRSWNSGEHLLGKLESEQKEVEKAAEEDVGSCQSGLTKGLTD